MPYAAFLPPPVETDKKREAKYLWAVVFVTKGTPRGLPLMSMHNPPHPGEFIRTVYLEPFGISSRFLQQFSFWIEMSHFGMKIQVKRPRNPMKKMLTDMGQGGLTG